MTYQQSINYTQKYTRIFEIAVIRKLLSEMKC